MPDRQHQYRGGDGDRPAISGRNRPFGYALMVLHGLSSGPANDARRRSAAAHGRLTVLSGGKDD